MYDKYARLTEYLRSLSPVAIAFSGGVDSTFLLKAAHDALGDAAVAVTIRSRLFPEREFKEAVDFCKKEGIRQIVIDADELKTPGFCENPKNRCYLCKSDMFGRVRKAVTELGIENMLEGSNKDDEGDYRPGLVAIAEQDIKSPLRDAGLTKAEIRKLSAEMGLPTWDKPSFACLATRFVYGETITA
ncbi:MAG: ATP-dependent sacrificial sulfur transferase LarE, partial [Clostridia bacterium]|nr:ATP-dependent sacrificial sulfur transferase LarE [Clostridia bacterium]